MRIVKALVVCMAAAAGVFGCPTLQAADNCSGHFNNVTHTLSTVEVGKDHVLTSFIFHSITNSENSLNNAVGECSGYALTTPDGKTRLAGVCARKTKDGGSFSDIWSKEPGAERGVWKMSGGTGALAGRTWSGWWQVVFEDGKLTLGKWGGTCN
jgi:hypothetical protein